MKARFIPKIFGASRKSILFGMICLKYLWTLFRSKTTWRVTLSVYQACRKIDRISPRQRIPMEPLSDHYQSDINSSHLAK